MIVELVDIIGYIKNSTDTLGKAFIFNIIEENNNYDCILFIHETIEPFVSLLNEDKYDKEKILTAILTKYQLKDLFEA